MKPFFFHCAVLGIAMSALATEISPVKAAIPSLQPAQRAAQSDIVVQVKIIAIVTKVVANKPGHNDDYLAKVMVEKSVKGKTRRGQMLTIHYGQLRDRPNGRPGPVGQNSVPKVGQYGTMFLKRGAASRFPFELLEPNGWEVSRGAKG